MRYFASMKNAQPNRLDELPIPRLQKLLTWAERTFGMCSQTAEAYRYSLAKARERNESNRSIDNESTAMSEQTRSRPTHSG